MLEVIVVSLEWSKGNVESDWNVGFEDCALWKDLEYGHVLSIEIFLFLRDPAESESALHFIGDFYLFLTAHCEYIAVAEVKGIVADTDELIFLSFQEEFFLKDVRMLSDLEVGLIEV